MIAAGFCPSLTYSIVKDLLSEVKTTFGDHGFALGQDKFEVAWIYRSERPGTAKVA
jgi:hypothetical protein